MKKFLANVLKSFVGNSVSILAGILVGFLVPKMMGLIDYANYKTYTLYLSYVALTSFGLGDGLLLKFAGRDRNELSFETLRYYIHRYYIQLLVFFSFGMSAVFIVPSSSRFIAISLCFTVVSSQIVGIYQNISILTSNFGEYSKRLIIKSVCSVFFILSLYVKYLITGKSIRYEVYIIGSIVIEYSLAIWYVFTYKELNWGKGVRHFGDEGYFQILHIGFPLLLSNIAGTIFMALDRQFVAILFPRESYAIYAFAYNMLTLLTTITSAVSNVIYPSMRKIGEFNIKEWIQKNLSFFSILMVFCLVAFFPLQIVVNCFLEKYIGSIGILRIILPGVVVSSCVTVLFFNLYKLENKVTIYFTKTVISLLFSALMNWIAWLFFRSYFAISWASIISLFLWFGLVAKFFVNKYQIRLVRECTYSVIMFVVFYGLTYFIENPYLGALSYLVVFFVVTASVYPKKIRLFFFLLKNNREKISRS